jgi:hypothetical protein
MCVRVCMCACMLCLYVVYIILFFIPQDESTVLLKWTLLDPVDERRHARFLAKFLNIEMISHFSYSQNSLSTSSKCVNIFYNIEWFGRCSYHMMGNQL